MRTTRIFLLVGYVGAIALGTLLPAKAQYYYPRPPDYGFNYPPPDDRYGYGWTWNDCPPVWTVQGGNCAPYGGHTKRVFRPPPVVLHARGREYWRR